MNVWLAWTRLDSSWGFSLGRRHVNGHCTAAQHEVCGVAECVEVRLCTIGPDLGPFATDGMTTRVVLVLFIGRAV